MFQEKLKVSEQMETEEGISSPVSQNTTSSFLQKTNKKSVTVESPPTLRKKIWKDKSSSLNENIPTTKLLKILDQASTLREKVLIPYWNQHSKEISTKLWLPT